MFAQSSPIRHSRESGNPAFSTLSFSAVSASPREKTRSWIPASAGMTGLGAGRQILLPERIERDQSALAFDMPEGPAVARRGALGFGADLVDRALPAIQLDRRIGENPRAPAPSRVREHGPRHHRAA